jgi:hypothetical protein
MALQEFQLMMILIKTIIINSTNISMLKIVGDKKSKLISFIIKIRSFLIILPLISTKFNFKKMEIIKTSVKTVKKLKLKNKQSLSL